MGCTCVYSQQAGLLGGEVLDWSRIMSLHALPVAGMMEEIGPHGFHHPPGCPELLIVAVP